MAKTDQSKRGKNYDVKGFGLGAAILTATQLKELYSLVAKVVGRLNDPTSDVLKQQLETRLRAADIDVDQHIPVRSFANRSILDPRYALPETLAHQSQLEKVEQAISECKAIRLKVNKDGELEQAVWPLQILFHNIAWYLAYQTTDLAEVITVARLDRLKLTSLLSQQRTPPEMLAAQEKLQLLCRRCGGIFFSRDPQLQRDVLGLSFQKPATLQRPLQTLSRSQLEVLIDKGSMRRVRFRCTPEVFAFMREGFNRYQPEQIGLSRPRSGDTWVFPDSIGIAKLEPLTEDNESHPYPVEFILPSWTVEGDIDFRRWLFGFDSRILIEAPELLREKHRKFGAGIAALYAIPFNTSGEGE